MFYAGCLTFFDLLILYMVYADSITLDCNEVEFEKRWVCFSSWVGWGKERGTFFPTQKCVLIFEQCFLPYRNPELMDNFCNLSTYNDKPLKGNEDITAVPF